MKVSNDSKKEFDDPFFQFKFFCVLNNPNVFYIKKLVYKLAPFNLLFEGSLLLQLIDFYSQILELANVIYLHFYFFFF